MSLIEKDLAQMAKEEILEKLDGAETRVEVRNVLRTMTIRLERSLTSDAGGIKSPRMCLDQPSRGYPDYQI